MVHVFMQECCRPKRRVLFLLQVSHVYRGHGGIKLPTKPAKHSTSNNATTYNTPYLPLLSGDLQGQRTMHLLIRGTLSAARVVTATWRKQGMGRRRRGSVLCCSRKDRSVALVSKSDGGGKCNPPNPHFVLPIEIFEKIAIWKASNMPIQYRRIKCRKEGGIRFTIDGAGIFLSVLISNVAGAGDLAAVKIKGSRTGWLPMNRNWGQNWHINADMKNQPLSFEVTSSDGLTVTSYNVAPKEWNFGQSFEGKQF
ncbi:unnamed protein product [Lactuca virosa]|uniref:Expansin n=1 Tax=Lactuca virosa TaxID=75947 RepID=A0AAU9NGP2_9ASTR|nr:unnamed protein product [Lactuca virosa]